MSCKPGILYLGPLILLDATIQVKGERCKRFASLGKGQWFLDPVVIFL